MSLFQSSAWQKAWWEVWGNTEGFQLLQEGGSCASGLYLDRYNFRSVIPITCLQFVGTNYRRISTPRTEYNSFGTGTMDAELTDDAIRRKLADNAWSEAVFRDIRVNTSEHEALTHLAANSGWLIRTLADDRTYVVDTSGTFEQYLDGLGRSTRLRLFNRRKLLLSLGSVDLSNAWPNSVDTFFELLNQFHVQRWGSVCFNPQSLAFHRLFLEQISEEGGEPELSVLHCDGRPVSVLYNVRYRGCTYNLQAGFFEKFHAKIALGTLHLGYSIEQAFSRVDVHTFDMLAGSGKNENYKTRLATSSQALVSLMLVRSPVLKLLYWLKG